VDQALLGGLVDHGNGAGERGFGVCGLARLQGFTELTQRGTQLGGVGAVARGACRGLAGAFQRRKMICHVACWFLLGYISAGLPKDLFYLYLAVLVNGGSGPA
jgi:hypothetical protein